MKASIEIFNPDKYLHLYLNDLVVLEHDAFACDVAYTKEIFNELSDRIRIMLVNNSLAGYYAYKSTSTLKYLDSIAVSRKFRGKGYGKILMEDFLNDFHRKFGLHVDPKNTKAIKFYESFGFEPTESDGDYGECSGGTSKFYFKEID